jgi:hypothetical protein
MGELSFGYFSLLIKVKVTRHQATSIKMGRRMPSLKPNFQLITAKRCDTIRHPDSSGFFMCAQSNIFVA